MIVYISGFVAEYVHNRTKAKKSSQVWHSQSEQVTSGLAEPERASRLRFGRTRAGKSSQVWQNQSEQGVSGLAEPERASSLCWSWLAAIRHMQVCIEAMSSCSTVSTDDNTQSLQNMSDSETREALKSIKRLLF